MPDHNEHHGHFVKDTYDNWPKNEGKDEHEECHTAHNVEEAEVCE